MRKIRFLLIFASLILMGVMFGRPVFQWLAVQQAHVKIHQLSETSFAKQSKQQFWNALHSADYESIPQTQAMLTGAYLQNPNDGELALLLGHTHLWKAAESSRLEQIGPDVTDALLLAKYYFEQAQRLFPEDHRIPGWLGSVLLSLGSIHADERLTRQGYFMLEKSATDYPEFNLFTFAYAMSQLPKDDPNFEVGMQHMNESFEMCFSLAKDGYLNEDGSFNAGAFNACDNAEKAPHNLEGFFLAYIEMLIKNGDVQKALDMFEAAKSNPGYASWSYKHVMEDRINNIHDYVKKFEDAKDVEQEPVLMARSNLSCTGCHAK